MRGEEEDKKRVRREEWGQGQGAQRALVKYDVRSLPFVQLVATRRNATASSFPFPTSSLPVLLRPLRHLLKLPLLPLFLLIFVAGRCSAIPPRAHRYAIARDVLGTFCRRSIDSVDSIEGRGKGSRGTDKDNAAADSDGRETRNGPLLT